MSKQFTERLRELLGILRGPSIKFEIRVDWFKRCESHYKRSYNNWSQQEGRAKQSFVKHRDLHRRCEDWLGSQHRLRNSYPPPSFVNNHGAETA